MNNKDHLLGDKFHAGVDTIYSLLGAQMFAPFSVLSNFFQTAINLQTDVVRGMNKGSGSKNESGMFTLETWKISPRVYSILEQKAEANELEDYITKLVERDLAKMEKEEDILASHSVVAPNGMGAGQANELLDSVTKLSEQKVDKEEFQTLLNSLRNEFLDEINFLKNELAFRPVVSANPNKLKPAMEHAEEVDDFKEGQLLESDQVTGTIKEVIDMDF